MTTETICPVCNGERWLFGQKDVSGIYGRPMTVRVSRVCPWCLGKGTVKPLPVTGREKAAQAENER
jgi:hypothetical protein